MLFYRHRLVEEQTNTTARDVAQPHQAGTAVAGFVDGDEFRLAGQPHARLPPFAPVLERIGFEAGKDLLVSLSQQPHVMLIPKVRTALLRR